MPGKGAPEIWRFAHNEELHSTEPVNCILHLASTLYTIESDDNGMISNNFRIPLDVSLTKWIETVLKVVE